LTCPAAAPRMAAVLIDRMRADESSERLVGRLTMAG